MLRPNDTFLAYADGSSLGNPGPAGWAFSLLRNGTRVDKAQGKASASNIEMELTAALAVLDHLDPTDVGLVRTDSEYVVKGINEWRENWIKRGWKTATGKPVAHRAMWESVFAKIDACPGVTFQWVKGHAGDPLNEEVDVLARSQAEAMAGLDPITEKVGQLRAIINARPDTPERSHMLEALDLIAALATP